MGVALRPIQQVQGRPEALEGRQAQGDTVRCFIPSSAADEARTGKWLTES